MDKFLVLVTVYWTDMSISEQVTDILAATLLDMSDQPDVLEITIQVYKKEKPGHNDKETS